MHKIRKARQAGIAKTLTDLTGHFQLYSVFRPYSSTYSIISEKSTDRHLQIFLSIFITIFKKIEKGLFNLYTIQNISDLLITVNHLYELLGHQIAFDSKGWPIFQKEHFINDWPEDMVTFDNRNSKIVKSKSSTLLCHFTGDQQNYRRFLKLNEDLPVYRNFCGVVFPDITVTYDMDIEMQRFTLLANQLYAATLAVNGIRLVVNTRCGSLLSLDSFDNIPRGVICASSFLGCRTASNLYDTSDYINKILKLMPSKLVIYGKQDFLINSQLDILGVNYRYYEDFHRRCKRRSA